SAMRGMARIYQQGALRSVTVGFRNPSVEANLDHLVGGAAGNRHGVAGALPDQVLAEGGLVGDAILEDVGFVRADQMELFVLSIGVLELERRSELGYGLFALGLLDDDSAVHQLLEVGDARLVRAL